jgi:hypothetical protein
MLYSEVVLSSAQRAIMLLGFGEESALQCSELFDPLRPFQVIMVRSVATAIDWIGAIRPAIVAIAGRPSEAVLRIVCAASWFATGHLPVLLADEPDVQARTRLIRRRLRNAASAPPDARITLSVEPSARRARR